MNFIRQRLVSLRSRARGLQNALRRWALYNDNVSREMKGDLLARFTPAERSTFDTDVELTRARLRPLSVQIQSLSVWFDYVLERVNEQFTRARELLDQGRHQECLAIQNDVEARMLIPNAETLGFAFRAFSQHASHEYHQSLAAIDAIIRDLYLPTVKLAHQRGLMPREALSCSPVAYLTDAPDGGNTWRMHALQSANSGRRVPISLLAVPTQILSQPWNLVALAHEVGCYVYADLGLNWEIANKLQSESINAGVSSQTAAVWSRWHEVLFADIFGVLKLGPTYVSGMIELLGRDPASAVNTPLTSPVPPAYIRWHIMLQTLQLLNLTEEARERFNQVHMLCGDPNQLAQQLGSIWLTLVNECRAVAGLIAFTPCQKLGGARVIDLTPPFLAANMQTANRVKEVLLAGDETCTQDEQFSWCETLRDLQPHLALAGLRFAHDATAEFETLQRLWVRFWCLMQFLTTATQPVREREDREFAPNEAALRSIAHHAVPAMA